MANSTNTMLAKMQTQGELKNPETVDRVDEPVLFATPQLKPGADLPEALKNILGASFNKEHTPLG